MGIGGGEGITGYTISQGQIWRCAFWSFGFSILCYALLTACAKRNPQWRRRNRSKYCRLHFACRLWTSTSLGFFTGLFKETLDAIPGVAWPWCGPQNPTWESPCRFEGRVVLVYYESAVVAMIVMIAYSMWRAYLRERRYRLRGQYPPCDETVAASVDNDNDDNWIDNNETELHDNNHNCNQKPNDDVDGGHAGTENNSESSVADDSVQLHFHSEDSSCNSSGETTIVTVVSVAAVPLYSNDDTLILDDRGEEQKEDYESSSAASKTDGDSLLVNAEEGLFSTTNDNSRSNENDSDAAAVAAATGHEVGDIGEDHDSQPLG